MKKIISFVVLAAMLVSLFVPATFAAVDAAAFTAADASVLEGGTSVSTTLGFEAPAAVSEFGGIIFWPASANVEEVGLTVDGAAFDAENTALGNVLAGNNRAVKDDLAAFGANTADYKACKVDFAALDALTSAEAEITFTFADATAAGQTFTFSIAALYADDEEVAEDAASATITILKDPNLGKYTDPTIFIVPEVETINPGATTVKVDVRVDANPGMWGGLFVLVYSPDWTIQSATCGSVYKSSDFESGVFDKKINTEKDLTYLKDRLACFPETDLNDNYVTAYFSLEDPNGVNTNNGILASYVFNVPAGMVPGDVAHFGIIYDKEGDLIFSNGDGTFKYIDYAVVGATVTMEEVKCDHLHTSEVTVSEPTCGAAGSKNVVCDDCGKVIETIEIPATGAHTYEDVVEAATCEAAGSKYQKCSVCGATTAPETIPALGHDWQFDSRVPATCKEGGHDLYKCSRCGAEMKDNYTEALPHTEGAPETVEATCTEDGAVVVKCTVCGEVLSTETIPAKGHDYEVVVTEPTCTEAGYTTHTCKVCGDKYVDGNKDALGHDYDMVRVAATCTKDGSVTYTCKTCGDSYSETLYALGHAYDDGVVTTAPTCTEKGVKTFTCSRCLETKTEEIAALGHKAGAAETTKEATCTEDGEKVTKCSVCGEVLSTEAVKALGHTWDEGTVTKEATADAKGEKTYKCTVCGEEKVEEYEYEAPVEPVKPDDKKDDEKKEEEKKPDNGQKSPVTGDNMMFIIVALVVVLASAAVIVIRRRKENN